MWFVFLFQNALAFFSVMAANTNAIVKGGMEKMNVIKTVFADMVVLLVGEARPVKIVSVFFPYSVLSVRSITRLLRSV